MLRSDFLRATSVLESVLAPLRSYLLGIVRQNRDPGLNKASTLLELYHQYRAAEANFGAAEIAILEVFDLKVLNSTELWKQLLGPETKTEASIHTTYSALSLIVNALPKFAELLKRDYESKLKSIDPKMKKGLQTGSIVTIILSEDAAYQSTPKRVTDAISGVEQVYRVLAELNDRSANDLALVGCDSGSDKSFDLLGAAETIHEFKALFIEMWDRVVFYRELKHAERIRQVSATLPILAQISELTANGALSPEKGELLKRQLLDGATKLLESGVAIPEVKSEAYHEPKDLLIAAPTLLLEGPSTSQSANGRKASPGSTANHGDMGNPEAEDVAASETSGAPSFDGLSDKERAQLDALLKKRRKQGNLRPRRKR